MRLYALLGYPLTHSFSQRFFTEKFAREQILDARYDLFPLPDIQELPQLLAAHPELCGLNVTIPHKETVLPWLDALDETARAVGAVNCIRIDGGRLTGYNTDVYGFEESLRRTGWLVDPETAQAFILGTGGAAKAVAYVLRKMGLPVHFVSRQPAADDQIAYDELRNWLPQRRALLVNTTPLGTFPQAGTRPPLPLDVLGSQHLVFDLVYNPPETLLLREARQRGCAVQNGLEMLHLQAEKAWEIWNDPHVYETPKVS